MYLHYYVFNFKYTFIYILTEYGFKFQTNMKIKLVDSLEQSKIENISLLYFECFYFILSIRVNIVHT